MEILQGSTIFNVDIYTSVDGGLVLRGDNINPMHDIISISTSKSLNGAFGTWTITFAAPSEIYDYWFNVVNVCDYVEISGAGIYDGKPQIIMRGLVDDVNLSEDYSTGEPQKRITISGRDLGALLNDINITFLPYIDPEEALFNYLGWKSFPVMLGPINVIFNQIWEHFQEKINLKFGNIDILSKIFMAVKPYNLDLVSGMEYFSNWQGTFFNAFKTYQDAPFHELILYDDYDYAHFVLRPSRLKDAVGNYHSSIADIINASEGAGFPGFYYPHNIEVDDKCIIRKNVRKSSEYIYNYYFIKTFWGDLTGHAVEVIAIGNESPKNSINPYFQTDPKLPAYVGKFGLRKLESQVVCCTDIDMGQNYGATADGGEGTSTRGQLWTSTKNTQDYVNDAKELNKTQVAWFLHNQYLLSGTIDIVGTNKAIVGSYIYCSSPMDRNEFYIEGVNHNWSFGQDFTTTLTVTRGQPKKGGVGIYGVKNKFYLDGTVTEPYVNLEDTNWEGRAGVSWGPGLLVGDIKKSSGKSSTIGKTKAADSKSWEGSAGTMPEKAEEQKLSRGRTKGAGGNW